MSTTPQSSAGLYKKLNYGSPRNSVDLEMVTDDILQVMIYIDMREKRVDDSQWLVADAVQKIASWMDFYKHMPFRSFTIGFSAAWNMLCAQKLKDQKKPPDRT